MEEESYIAPKTWIELLKLAQPKEKKIAILKDDKKLAYSNPGPLRKEFLPLISSQSLALSHS